MVTTNYLACTKQFAERITKANLEILKQSSDEFTIIGSKIKTCSIIKYYSSDDFWEMFCYLNFEILITDKRHFCSSSVTTPSI